MTTFVPVQDPALIDQLNGAPARSGPQGGTPATFLGGTKENWMDQIPPAATAVGGIVGTVGGALLASPSGPGAVPAGVAGGAVGAGAGNYIGNVALNALKNLGVYERGEQKSMPQMGREAVGAAAADAAFGMGVPIAGRAFQGVKAGVLGVGKPELEAARRASDMGVNLGIADVSRRALPQMYEKVIGNFPFMGGPIRKAFDRKVGEVAKAVEDVPQSIGIPRGQSESGVELTEAAEKAYKNFRSGVDTAYKRARELASSAEMNTTSLRKSAQEIIDQWDAQVIPGVSRQEPPIVAHARQVASMPERVNFQQYEGQANELDRLMSAARGEGFRIKQTVGASEALEADLSSLSSPEALQAWQAAKAIHSEGIQKFLGPTAQQFGRVDRNMFRPGFERPGSLNPDELFSRAFDTKSPMAMKELRNIVGEDAFANALATHLERKLSGAMAEDVVGGKTTDIFSPQKAATALGLNNTKSPEFQALATAFNVAGRPEGIRALNQLMEAAALATSRGSPNVSQFLARRGVMGGIGALESALPVGAAAGAISAGHNPLTPLIGFIAANRMSRHLADPRFLREMAIIIDPRTPAEFREAVFKRVFAGHIVAPATPTPWTSDGR